ncbi:MAG TPA: TonB-dependent receptor [Thermoanaerobaculia bacterium]|jgi:outer membrane cobalamin receptor
MADLTKLLAALLIALILAPAVLAQDADDEDAEPPAPTREVSDVIIVTASRTEQSLHEVPSAFSVVTAEDIETTPADDVGDLLRNLPGLNVTQAGARDIQVSSRSAASTLATDQLVLLDGRTLYLDFFGFVMWDFLPVNTAEIKQIEVVRGPGSAVWGANAMTGVINVITKKPGEMAGTSLLVGGGEFDTLYGGLTHAGARDKVGYKVSLGYYQQDPYPRPTGIIPGTEVTNPPGTPYPPFANEGTEQPKVDLRLDYDSSDATTWSFSAGYAGTDGIVHTGIGPFAINSGTNLGYFKGSWFHGAQQLTFFANLLDGDAANLLTVGPDGLPLLLGFESQTYNLEYTDTKVFGESHIVTYGARARQNEFDLSIAPTGENRDELGVFVQDEILFGEKVRWLIGARWDDLDPIGSVVSPRTSLLFGPNPDHTFRLSYNQAYRQPSLINNHLDIVIVNQLQPLAPGLPPGVPIDANLIFQGLVQAGIVPPGVPCEFVLSRCSTFFYDTFPTNAVGNPNLNEEALEAFEVGYVGSFGHTTLSLSLYRNEIEDSTDFFGAAAYTSTNPPPNWPLFFLANGIPIFPSQLNGLFPSLFSYRNIGETVNEGVELAINARPSSKVSWFANYTYQADPDTTGIPEGEVNLPPNNRFNFGLSYDAGRFYVNGTVNYTDEAFWTDVLDSRFWGATDDFTIVNLGFGVRFNDDKITFAVIGTNILDEDFQAHIFGDVIPRRITGELRFRF